MKDIKVNGGETVEDCQRLLNEINTKLSYMSYSMNKQAQKVQAKMTDYHYSLICIIVFIQLLSNVGALLLIGLILNK